MNLPKSRRSRRAFLGTVASTAAFFTVKGAFAEQLASLRNALRGRFILTSCLWTLTTT